MTWSFTVVALPHLPILWRQGQMRQVTWSGLMLWPIGIKPMRSAPTMPKVKGAKRSSFAPVAEELKVRFIDYGYVFGLLVLFTRVCWNLTHSTIRHQIRLLVRACSVVQGAQLWQSAQVQESQWCSSAPVDGSFRFHHFNIDFCLPMSR